MKTTEDCPKCQHQAHPDAVCHNTAVMDACGCTDWRVTGMSTLTFTIPKQLWLTSNRHSINRGHRAAIVQRLHALAHVTAITGKLAPITGLVAAYWTVRYPKGVRADKGDASNAQPTCKALLDGIVPRWLPDDGPKWILSETYRRGPNLDRAGDHEITLLLIDQEDQ